MRATALAVLLWSASLTVLAQTPAPALPPPQAEPATRPIAAAPTTQPTTAPALGGSSTEELLVRARALTKSKSYADARSILSEVLQRDPDSAETKLLMAELAEASGDSDSARNFYKEVLRRQPNNFDANLGLGRSYVKARYWRQGPVYLEPAARIAPPDKIGEVLDLLAQAYLGERQKAKALETAEKAVKSAPDYYEARETLVNIRLNDNQFDRALEDARVLQDIAMKEAQAKPEELASLKRLLAAYSTRISVLQRVHNNLYQVDARGNPTDRILLGKERDAAAILRQIVDMAVLKAAVEQTVSYHDILPLAERAVEYDPANPAYHLQLGQLYERTSRIDKAIEQYQRVLELDANNDDAIRFLQHLNAPATSRPAQADATQRP